MITCLLCLPLSAQNTQNFIEGWLNTFSGLSNPQNTGLTTFPILELSPGGQRSNMANAFTALANDISFFESNPAASSILQSTELAFFHRNLISDVSLDSIFFTQRFQQFGYGVGTKFLHFEFTSFDSLGNQLASATPVEILFVANTSYNFFANYLFTGVSAGLNVKLAYRSVPSELYEHVLNPDAYDQSLVGVLFDVGFLSRFNFLKGYASREKNFSLGLSGLNFGPAIQNTSSPAEIRLGFAYKPLSFLTVTSDANVLINLVDLAKSEGFGFAAGFDLHFVNFFGLQGGLEWRGANPRFSMGATIDLVPVSFHITYTLDLSTSLSSLDNFSVGAVLNFGDEGRATLQEQIDELYIEALVAFSESDFEKAIMICEQIINPETGLDPSFTPARNTLQLALASMEQEQSFRRFEQNPDDIFSTTEPE